MLFTCSFSQLSTKGDRPDLNPYLLLHRQACRNRYTTDTINSVLISGRSGSRTRKAVSTVLDRLPTGSRARNRQSGCPSVCLVFNSSPTRIRTRNISLEARHDVRFTIERKRKAWDLNPYPKVARFSKPARQAVSGYLPSFSSGAAGQTVSGYLPLESTPICHRRPEFSGHSWFSSRTKRPFPERTGLSRCEWTMRWTHRESNPDLTDWRLPVA